MGFIADGGSVFINITGNTDGLKAAMSQAEQSVRAGSFSMQQTAGMAFTAVGTVAAVGFGAAISSAMDYNSAMAKVATLGVKDLDGLGDAVKSVAADYGLELTPSVTAVYDALSSGVTEMEAPLILEKAAKAATAGVSDLATSIELGTSVTNAFGGEMSNMDQIFDQAFVAAQYGVTTFEELSSSVGKVAPMFAAAKLGSDEMFSAVGALTLGGLATSEAVSSLKAALAGIIKPTSEASDMAESLGLDFSAAALETKGLAGFMADLQEKTGGNLETMAMLFGSVEGMNAMLTLTGQQGDMFNQMLEEMRGGTGQTDAAFQALIANDPSFAFRQMKAELAVAAVEIGEVFLPAMKAVVDVVVPLVQSIREFAQENPMLFNGLVLVAGGLGMLSLAIGATMLVFSPLLTAVTSLVGALGGLGTATAAAAGTGGAAAAGGAVAATGAVAGGAGLAGLGAGALAAGLGLTALVGVVGLSGIAVYALVKTYGEYTEATEQQKKSAADLEVAELRLIMQMQAKGYQIDENIMKEKDAAELRLYLANEEKNSADVMARAWFEYYAGKEESEEAFGQMRNLMLNEHIDSESAAILVSKGLSDDKVRELMRMDQEQTRAALDQMGVRAEAEKATILDLGGEAVASATQRQTLWRQEADTVIAENKRAADESKSYWQSFMDWFKGLFGYGASPSTPQVPAGGATETAGFARGGVVGMGSGASVGGMTPIIVGENGPELRFEPVGTRILSHEDSMAAVAAGMGGGGWSQNISIDINNPVVRSDADITRLADEVAQRISTSQGRTFEARRQGRGLRPEFGY